MGAYVAWQIKVSRNGLIMTRTPVAPIGTVDRVNSTSWKGSCERCDRSWFGRTRADAANLVWEHWKPTHGSGDPS